jgi:hypothetical protein
LLKLAMAGKMRAIRTEAGRIRGLGEQYRPFADKLEKLAATYQSPAILRMIEDILQEREAA